MSERIRKRAAEIRKRQEELVTKFDPRFRGREPEPVKRLHPMGHEVDNKGRRLNKKVNERELDLAYVIAKVKGSRKAFKTVQRPNGKLYIKGNADRGQLWLTLRVAVRDEWDGDSGFLDVDMYLPATSLNRRKLNAWLLECADL